jgi:hypothetical protein
VVHARPQLSRDPLGGVIVGEEQCPICFGELEVRSVTPCMDCGGHPDEQGHLYKHHYNEYQVFPGLNLVLCNFCDVDFGSYSPEHFGPKCKTSPDLSTMQLVRAIRDVRLSQDKFCQECGHRLAFLRFLVAVRAQHS